MAKQTIDLGSVANDGTGTTLRAGGDIINDNFTEVYDSLSDVVLNADTVTTPMQFVIDEDNFSSNLATKVPTQQSTKAYIASQIASAIVGGVYYQGSYNAGTNTPNLETPTAGTIFKGFMWTVTVLGDFFTESVQVGDVLIAEVDDPSVLADWTVVQSNLDASSIKALYESNADTNAFTDAEQTKVGFVSVTQAVDLDTMESDIVTNNAKVTNVSTDLSEGTSTTTTVDVNSSDGTNATLLAASTSRAGLLTKAKFDEIVANNAKVSYTDAAAVGLNTAKVTYPSVDSTKVGYLSVTQAVDLDDVESKANDAVLNTDTVTTPMGFVIDEDSFASDLATKVPTQQSVKAYVTAQVASAIVGGVYYQGSYNAGTNSPDLEAPTAGTVFKGFMWTVTVLGDFFTEAVQVGDVLIAEVDDPAALTDWTVVQSNLDAASIKALYESNANTNAFTDAEKTNLGNQSGTNTGDNATNTLYSGLQSEVDLNTAKVSFDSTSSTRLANTSGTNTGDQDLSGYLLNTTDTLTGDLTVTGTTTAQGTGDSSFVGNVGIGTTTPSQALEVNGNIKASVIQLTTGATDTYVLTSDASGNASWAAAAGGGGGWSTVYKTTDTNKASTTSMSADPQLKLTGLDTNSTYAIQIFVLGYSASTLPDMKWRLYTAGTTADVHKMYGDRTTGGGYINQNGVSSFPLSSAKESLFVVGTLYTTTGTSMDFSWAQDNSYSTASTLKAGSWISYKKLN